MRKKGCEVKKQTSFEGRFGFVGCEESTDLVLQESQPDGGVTGTPLEREASS